MYSFFAIYSILVAIFVAASSSLIIKDLNSRDSYSLVGPEVCKGFAGNPGLYRLGIRLDIYLQWSSSLLTNSLLPTTVSDSLDTNSIFLFAVFITVAVAANLPGGLHLVEAFIMLQLCFGFLLSVLSVNGFKIILLYHAHVLEQERMLSRLRRTPGIVHRQYENNLYEFTSVRYRELRELIGRSLPGLLQALLCLPSRDIFCNP